MIDFQLSSPLSAEQERVIRRAALAERRYWRLVKRLEENPAARRAVLEARVRIDAELRAPGVTVEPADLSEPLDVAVDREVARQRPVIRQLLAARRATRREGMSGCGLVQLALSRPARLRRHFSAVVSDSGLRQWQVAEAIGLPEDSVSGFVGGRRMRRASATRKSWISRLESVTLVDGYYCIVTRPGAPRRPYTYWKTMTAGEREAAYRSAGLAGGNAIEVDDEATASAASRTAEARILIATVEDRAERGRRAARAVGGAVAKRIGRAAELRQLIAHLLRHGPRDRAEVIRSIRRAGFSERQLLRNGQALELRYLRVGVPGSRGGGKYVIALPAHVAAQKGAQSAHTV